MKRCVFFFGAKPRSEFSVHLTKRAKHFVERKIRIRPAIFDVLHMLAPFVVERLKQRIAHAIELERENIEAFAKALVERGSRLYPPRVEVELDISVKDEQV